MMPNGKADVGDYNGGPAGATGRHAQVLEKIADGGRVFHEL